MKLTIIIPVFNEKETIAKVLEQVIYKKLDSFEKEIIVIDDGSTDGTSEELENLKRKTKDVLFLRHKTNLGKGAAVKTGFKKATGDYILIQDADLEYSPNDIDKLLHEITKEKNIVVYGTRLNRLPNFSRDERTPRFFIQYLGNKFLSLITSILYGQWITDMETGYKLFPRYAVETMTIHARSFDFEPEITAKLMQQGFKIKEVSISTNPRSKAEGKKLSAFRDGPIAFWTLLKYKFSQ